MASRFSDEFIARLKAEAPLDLEKCEAIALETGEKTKAVIACAIRHGIEYKRKEKVSAKTGEPVVTKADLVAEITEKLGLAEGELDGLDKATKLVLEKVVDALS